MTTRKAFKIAIGVISGIILLIVALIVLLFTMPNSWLNALVGGKGSAAVGRDFAIEGKIDLDWDWDAPHVLLNKIKLGNMEGSEDPNMVEIETLDFNIKIWKLLMGRVELPELTITKPKIILEKNAEGEKNWDFPALSKSNAAVTTAVPSERGDFPVIGTINISDGVFIYRDPQKGLSVNLTLETVQGGGLDSDEKFVLKGDGTLQDQKFTIDVTGGSLKSLRDSGKDYPLNLALGMGNTKITFNGTFSDPVQLKGISANLVIEGSDMADLFYLTSIPLPPTPPYRLAGTLKKEGEIWSYQDFDGKVGGSDLEGNLKYNTEKERGLVQAELTSNLLDAKDLGGFIGLPPQGMPAKELSAEQKEALAKQKQSPKALPDVPLKLERLRATDMDVTLNAKEIRAPGWPLESMNVHFDLKDGVLKLDPMTLGIAKGKIEGKLALDGSQDVPDVNMDLVLKKLSLRQFFSGTQFEDFSAGHFGGRVQLAGKGKSLADVLGNSDGHVTMSMSGGKISLLIVEAAGIDMMELAPRLLGDDKKTDIRCVIGDFVVNKGLLKSNILVFDTSDSNIQGDAEINLKTEEMDIQAEAQPKDESLLSLKTPITVGGTLKNPALGINPGELGAKTAGAIALGALLTPVAAIIPFIELGLGEDSDCRGLIAQARANQAKGAPPEIKNTAP